MKTLVIGNPLVLLGEADVIEDGALVVEDGTIVDVGPRERFAGGEFDEVIGSPDHFVMPGFVNCHYHSEVALGQGVYEYIFERANIWMHGMFASISEEDLYHAVLVHLAELIRGGQTAAVDMYYGNPTLPGFGTEVALSAWEDSGLRVAFGLVSRDQNRYVHQDDAEFRSCLPAQLATEIAGSPIGYTWPLDQVLGTYRDLVERWDGRDDRIRVILAPDWTPACSDDLYRETRRLADEYATGITTHALETRSEMSFNFEHYGMCGMERLQKLGVLGDDTSLAHFVWATDRDIDLLVETGSVSSNDPGSNLRLSSGIARVRDIIDRGGKAGFGTDGISFGDREDFFDEIRLAALLQRRPMELASGRISSSKLFRSAITSGARAVRAEDRLGSLEPGKDADLLVLRRDHVFWPPQRYAGSDPLDVIVDRADQSDIDTVMVRGRSLLRGGEIVSFDERKVREAYADAAANRLWKFAEPQERRWVLELPGELEPYVLDFYRRWTDMPTDPGYSYNTTSGPERDTGGA
ncbi:MAG: amidohydrolase family protein [Actinobacteria bacterium]|nr:amidohydrolase family protein [Actinomycetota bacterium]